MAVLRIVAAVLRIVAASLRKKGKDRRLFPAVTTVD
jgi:hypothetical protein